MSDGDVIWMSGAELRKRPCPHCGKKGLSFAHHPHAFGYKDHTRVSCRYCKRTFKKKQKKEKS